LVTVKDLGDTVEMTVLLPVVKKELSLVANKTGYNVADLKSYGFNLTLKTHDFIEFVQDVMLAHTRFQDERAIVIKKSFDVAASGE
jgi:hypothetical protein